MSQEFYNTDTPATRHAAGRAVSSWNIDGGPKLLGRLENFTYEAGSNGRERIIRITEPSHRTIAEIEAELDWLRFISEQGISVAGPLPSENGNLVETFDAEDGPYLVSVFTKAPGRPMRFSLDWNPEFHRNLGELIGRMHAATMIYRPSEGIQQRGSWLEEMRYVGQFIPKHEALARREFDEVVEWASSLETSPDTFGLVHTDLNYSNFFVGEASSITAFDFDDCHYNWFAYDLAVTLFYALLAFDLPSMDAAQQDWFNGPLLEGYGRHMDISDEWIKRVPGFVRYRRIDLFAFICKELDLDNLTDPWDIKAMRRIREGFLSPEPLV